MGGLKYSQIMNIYYENGTSYQIFTESENMSNPRYSPSSTVSANHAGRPT